MMIDLSDERTSNQILIHQLVEKFAQYCVHHQCYDDVFPLNQCSIASALFSFRIFSRPFFLRKTFSG